MTDNDQSSAAARRPHRPDGDNKTSITFSEKASTMWTLIKSKLPGKHPTLREDLQDALDAPVASDEDTFTASERTILQNVLKLGDLRVDDVMVPRSDIEAVEQSVIIGSIIAHFRDGGHSRMPVYDDDLDSVMGMVHIKDVLDCITTPEIFMNPGGEVQSPIKLRSESLHLKLSEANIVRKVLFVPPSMPITDLLASMQSSRIHMAIVVDEYGGTDGLVTIEDLLEAVVGNIEDEHDVGAGIQFKAVTDDVFLADARIELPDLVAAIGDDFDVTEYMDDVDTLGGLIFTLAGHVPVRGEVLEDIHGYNIEVLRSDARRVRVVRITRIVSKEQLMLEAPRNGDTFTDQTA